MSTVNKYGVDLGWLADKLGEQKIIGRGKDPVTEKSEKARREYWSNYHAKKNHINKACAHW